MRSPSVSSGTASAPSRAPTTGIVSREKADALRKLAALIERIVNPPADNVVPLHEAVAS